MERTIISTINYHSIVDLIRMLNGLRRLFKKFFGSIFGNTFSNAFANTFLHLSLNPFLILSLSVLDLFLKHFILNGIVFR